MEKESGGEVFGYLLVLGARYKTIRFHASTGHSDYESPARTAELRARQWVTAKRPSNVAGISASAVDFCLQ